MRLDFDFFAAQLGSSHIPLPEKRQGFVAGGGEGWSMGFFFTSETLSVYLLFKMRL